jgi:2-aminobenzoate-CoA ligase
VAHQHRADRTRRLRLAAYVALRGEQGGNATTIEQLQRSVKARLLPFRYPRRVEYMARRTGTWKMDRAALRTRNTRT